MERLTTEEMDQLRPLVDFILKHQLAVKSGDDIRALCLPPDLYELARRYVEQTMYEPEEIHTGYFRRQWASVLKEIKQC